MGRRGWGALFAFLVLAAVSCSSPAPSDKIPLSDIGDGRPYAREIAQTLLTFSAYDYALVGDMNGERLSVVNSDRYATIATEQAERIASEVTNIVATTIDTQGPVRDRLVTLADTLGDLRRDALTYADARDAATFVKIIDGVSQGWSHLHDLAAVLKDDAELDATIKRGMSFQVRPAAGNRALVTVGPFAGAKEAAEQAALIGDGAVPSGESPFVVRAVYPDRKAAEAAMTVLRKKGYTPILVDQTQYAFARSGLVPTAELWREPDRYIDTRAGARVVGLSPDASLVATGADDGFIAIYTRDGVLKSLPKLNAGVNTLLFSDDTRFLMGGGQTLAFWVMPAPPDDIGVPVRLYDAVQSAVFVPSANAFVAASRGPGANGIIGARADDGAVLSDPFPMLVSSAGAYLGTSTAGELFIGTQRSEGFEVSVLLIGREKAPRGIVRVPGNGRAFTVDPSGRWGAAITDQGTYRFSLKSSDPTSTIKRIAGPARDVRFASDATLYVLDAKSLAQVTPDGVQTWSAPLVDGRRLVVGSRPVVLDGTEKLVAFTPKDGTPDALAPVGTIQDLTASADGKWIAVIADAWRAVLFHIQ